MSDYHYVRRCKTREGYSRYKMLHAADINHTLCGKVLDNMWWVEAYHKYTPKDVTCPVCRGILKNRGEI